MLKVMKLKDKTRDSISTNKRTVKMIKKIKAHSETKVSVVEMVLDLTTEEITLIGILELTIEMKEIKGSSLVRCKLMSALKILKNQTNKQM